MLQVLAGVFLAIFLGLLWLPSVIVLMLKTHISIREMIRRSWLLWLLQIPTAIALIYLAIGAGLGESVVLFLAIPTAVGWAGAIFLLKQDPRQ